MTHTAGIGEQSYVKEKANLRSEAKESIRELPKGEVVWILDRSKPNKTFDLGFFSFKQEHYWVRLDDNTEGWVRKNALVLTA